MTIHADSSFTPHEQDLILTASERIASGTSDFLNVHILFDLEFDSISSLRKFSRENIMVRVSSLAADLDSATLGYCLVNFSDLDMNNPTKIALVYDRLVTDDVWIHVVMHEMLHALRHQHISEPKSIMYASTPVTGKEIVTCLTEDDVKEICTVHGCDMSAMKACKP